MSRRPPGPPGPLRSPLARVAAVLVAVLAAVLGVLPPGQAMAAAPSPPSEALLAAPSPPAGPVRLELSQLSPRVVTLTSAGVLQLRGRVVNAGDQVLSKLAIRVQRGEPMRSEPAAEQAVTGRSDAPHLTRSQPLGGDLPPGQSLPFQLDVPLRGGAEPDSLQINQPGVYPLLVTLTGTAEASTPTRLAAAPFLLPVLGVPGGAVSAAPALPAGLTMIWPLAAVPALVPTAPGEPVLLRSDRIGTDPLAAEIAPGGRLDGLLGALEQALPPGSPLAPAVCVAVDPLLLETLDGMSRGYRVTHPGGISEGTGARDARSWLDRLRATVQGRCVLALPYADADLVALSRAGLTDLEALATSAGARLVAELLGVQPLAGVSWPAGEVLDERTLADLAALGTHAVLLNPTHLVPQPPPPGPVAQPVNLIGGSSRATNPGVGGPSRTTNSDGSVAGTRPAAPVGLLVDPLMSTALASPTGPLPAQDAVGVLVYRAIAGRSVLIVPPRRWQISGPEAAALLSSARQLVDSGLLSPRELAALATVTPNRWAGTDTDIPHEVNYPPQASADEIPPQITAEIKRDRDILRDLQVATVLDPAANLKPASLLEPMRLGLLRATATAWRGQPSQALQATEEESNRLDELRRSVRIVPPPGPYTLAASNAPLLITVSNELPVGVQVAVSLSETPGLRAGAVGVQLVPAHSTRQLVIPAKVNRAGQFSVDAWLSTPGGTPLGEPSTLQLHSTAFGTVTVALTAGAGGLLVLLVIRGFARRVRRARRARTTREAPHAKHGKPGEVGHREPYEAARDQSAR